MSCPTCDKTFECVARGIDDAIRVFQCPVCGTVKVEDDRTNQPAVYVPKLVERCRSFERFVVPVRPDLIREHWRISGIAESIHRPEDRPNKE